MLRSQAIRWKKLVSFSAGCGVPGEGVFGGSIKTVYGESRGISNARGPTTSSGGISREKSREECLFHWDTYDNLI